MDTGFFWKKAQIDNTTLTSNLDRLSKLVGLIDSYLIGIPSYMKVTFKGPRFILFSDEFFIFHFYKTPVISKQLLPPPTFHSGEKAWIYESGSWATGCIIISTGLDKIIQH